MPAPTTNPESEEEYHTDQNEEADQHEHQIDRASGTLDRLGAGGAVVARSAYQLDRTNENFAAVLGMDAEVSLTPHLAVTPGVRFHWLPGESAVEIVRPGIGVRWRF